MKEAVSRLLLAALLAAGGPASALGADTTPTPTPTATSTPVSDPSPHPPASVVIWQTSFDCPDWTQFDYFAKSRGARPCPGTAIGQYGGWTVGGNAGKGTGTPDRITVEANRPGSPGKGFRHYRGNGMNVNGGGIVIDLKGQHTELWARFYMRYQQGFAWANGQPHYTKDMYFNVGSSNGWAFGIQGGPSWGIFDGKTSHASSKTWAATMGGDVGDGQWHCYEWHVNHSTGLIEIWVDGAQVLSKTVSIPGPTKWLALGENQNQVAGAAIPWYTDYDDIAFSATGRVGC